MPKVSIIVPVFNAEKHLSKCIVSILNQSLDDYEVILVNDASPDGSLTICEQFAARDPRVKVIDKKVNEGVDLARFSGLGAARGEYIYFIDSDDYLSSKTILEDMVSVADDTGVDYVCMRYRRTIGRSGWEIRSYPHPEYGLVAEPELKEKYYLSQFGWPVLSPNVWDKLYRKSTLDTAAVEPTGLKYGEDSAFNLFLFPHLKSIYLLDKFGYDYRVGGISGSGNNKRWFEDQKQLYRLRVQEADRNNFPQGDRHAKAQLLAVFESMVTQTLSVFKLQEVKQIFTNELGDEFWDDVLRVKEHPEMFETPFMKALAARDVDEMVRLSLPAAKKMKIMSRLKKIANAVLSGI